MKDRSRRTRRTQPSAYKTRKVSKQCFYDHWATDNNLKLRYFKGYDHWATVNDLKLRYFKCEKCGLNEWVFSKKYKHSRTDCDIHKVLES